MITEKDLTNFTLPEFKHELRLLDSGDPWGTAIGTLFDVVGELWYRGEYIPDEWNYSPGAGGDGREEESYWYELFENTLTEDLWAIAYLLERYTQYLRYKGMDY